MLAESVNICLGRFCQLACAARCVLFSRPSHGPCGSGVACSRAHGRSRMSTNGDGASSAVASPKDASMCRGDGEVRQCETLHVAPCSQVLRTTLRDVHLTSKTCTEKHTLYQCPGWNEVKRQVQEACRKCEQKARTSKKEWQCKEVLSSTRSVKVNGTGAMSG